MKYMDVKMCDMFYKINLVQKPSLHLIMLIHLFFGNYYNISASKIASVLLRLYCMCFTPITLLLFIQFSPDGLDGVPVIITIASELTLFSFLSQVHSQKYILEYVDYINTCDKLMGSGDIPVDKYFNVAFLLIVSTRLGLICWSNLFDSAVLTICWCFMVPALDIRKMKITAVIRLLHTRLSILRKNLEQNRIPVCLVNSLEIKRNIYMVRKCLFNYDHLLDAFDDVNIMMQMKYFSMLIINMPKMIMTSYFAIKVITFDVHFRAFIYMIMDLCLLFVLISGPCVASEMCSSEVDEIKELLTKQILRCSDVKLRRELQWALDSVSRRPFSFSLLRTIPVNIHLSVSIFTLGVTYVILLLQFTHFITL